MPTIRARALLIAFLGLPAPAVNAAPGPSPFIRMSLAPGMTRGAFVARAFSVFERLDADGDGYLDAADALAYAQGQAAIARAENVSRILAFDLDGDGRVDLAELSAGLRAGLPLPASVAGAGALDAREAAAAAMATLDRDADGKVSFAEMLALPVPEAGINPVAAFLEAFPAPGGRLQKGAFVAGMLAQAFDRADRDGDGTLTREEVDGAFGP